MSFVRQKSGLFICILSLFIFFLLRLPLNLSVACANENQGLGFIWGQNLLLWHDLVYGRGLLYVLLYAAVLKIFGFNTLAIVGIHILETIISISIGILLYLIVQKILKNDFWAGICVLVWITLICTPIGKSSLIVEIASHYNLDEEYLCVLFSLCSILCFSLGNFFDSNQNSNFNIKEKIFSILSGVFAVCSLMSKASGAILCIAVFVWFLQACLFQRENFRFLKLRFLYYFLGMLLSLLLFNFVLYVLYGDLLLCWKNYFFVGSYSHDYLNSCSAFFQAIYRFMTRCTDSVSNFILFFTAFVLFVYGLLKGCFGKKNDSTGFWSLISIWGIGNACAIIVPGDYQPYYYHLIWTSISVIFVLGMHELFLFLKTADKKRISIFVSVLVSIFFIYRIAVSIPAHCDFIRALNALSVFNQPQSLQDPVLPYKTTLNFRPLKFRIADEINILLPDKKSTFYILDFSGKRLVSSLSYIYAKRCSPTSIDVGLLAVQTIIETKLKILKRDLSVRKPDVLIVPESISLQPWQAAYLPPFLDWADNLIKNNYRLENSFNLLNPNETFFIYRKVK